MCPRKLRSKIVQYKQNKDCTYNQQIIKRKNFKRDNFKKTQKCQNNLNQN